MRFQRFAVFTHIVAACALVSPRLVQAQSLPTIPGIPPTASQETAPQGAPEAPAVPAKRAEIAEFLRVAQRKLEGIDPADSVAAQSAAQEVAVFQSIDAALAQQAGVEQQIKDLTARKAELETQLQSPPAASSSAGEFTFADLDRLKDELAAERSQASLVESKLSASKAALEKSQRAFDEQDGKRRKAQEAAETGKQQDNAAELRTAAELASQAARLARETVTLRQIEVSRDNLAQQVQKLAVQLRERQLAQVSPWIKLTEADHDKEIEAIKAKEESATRLKEKATIKLRTVEADLRATQQALDAETGDRTLLTEKLETLRREQEKRTAEIDSFTQRLSRLAELRVAWSRRLEIATAGNAPIDKQRWDTLKSWQRETDEILGKLTDDLRIQIFAMRALRSSLTSIAKKAETTQDAPPEVAEFISKQRASVEAALRVHERNLGSIEDSRRLHEKLAHEIAQRVQANSPTHLAYGAWSQVERAWDYELTSVEENGIPRRITIGKVTTALIIFITGWILARMFAALFANRLLQRFRLSKDATAAIRTLVFYLLLIANALIALRWAYVPLTAFTILGGALAIGVGFGSQALVTNFIGGLIMLAERPVRLGERILFGKYDGTVEDVGFRCTKLRTSDDHLITIPNSTLVNDPIENTARRRTIRRQVNISITYDTPREKIASALQAIRDLLEEKGIRERIHPIVGFDEMGPRVHFNDFNAESLNLQITYWYAPPEGNEYLEHCERVNFRIMEEFERLGISFAFPSRTIYVAGEAHRPVTGRMFADAADPRKSVA